MFICVTVICILFVCVYFLFSLCFLCCFSLQISPSVLWYCWLGLLTCKNRLPYNLYCVGGDVKHCSINQCTAASLLGVRTYHLDPSGLYTCLLWCNWTCLFIVEYVEWRVCVGVCWGGERRRCSEDRALCYQLSSQQRSESRRARQFPRRHRARCCQWWNKVRCHVGYPGDLLSGKPRNFGQYAHSGGKCYWIIAVGKTNSVIQIKIQWIRPKILYTLMFRLPPEVFIRRMKHHFFIRFLAQ